MSSVSENLARVHERLERACRRAGRNPAEVRLMGVSKRQPIDRVRAAYDAGLRLFGENRVQEALSKIPTLPDDIEWHLIGHLQRNKAKDVVGRFTTIQSLDRIATAEALQTRLDAADLSVDILLEVNTSGEETKFGVHNQDELLTVLDHVLQLDRLHVRGLMTIGPLTTDHAVLRPSFRMLRRMFDTVRARYPNLPFTELSMGMSGDMEPAIEEGSTMVRVGTAIFGERIE